MALIPIEDVPNPFNLWDKTQHALAFVVLTITGCLAYPKKTKVVYIGLILYGASIEIMQSTFTTTRVGEISDLLADTVGVGIGFIIYLVVRKTIQSSIWYDQ
jgi:VanZ family protein